MKLLPSDPDVQTIVRRIASGDIDLQPDFQRGSVWNTKKKQLLIDTILRDWHIPPVHIVSQDDAECDEVLDGQQRLTAIYEFFHDVFSVDGNIEPYDSEVKSLHGLKFSELPSHISKRLNKFPIRVLSVTDFNTEEPGELFYRLNHQVTLTPAETRNAYFGRVRDQVREVAKHFETWGLTKQAIGFSNARMAHDDVVARIMSVLDWGTLSEKVTANKLADRYRSGPEFPDHVVKLTSKAFESLGGAISLSRHQVKLNKATLWSWVLFVSVYYKLGGVRDDSLISEYMEWFEKTRKESVVSNFKESPDDALFFEFFNDRASSRVSDASSVIVRDLVLWALLKKAPVYSILSCSSQGLIDHIEKAEKNLLWYYKKNFPYDELDEYSAPEDVDAALEKSWGDVS